MAFAHIGWSRYWAYLWRIEGHKGWVQNLTGANQAIGDADPQKAGSKPHSQQLQAIAADCACSLADAVGSLSFRDPLKCIVRAGIKESYERILGAVILRPTTSPSHAKVRLS